MSTSLNVVAWSLICENLVASARLPQNRSRYLPGILLLLCVTFYSLRVLVLSSYDRLWRPGTVKAATSTSERHNEPELIRIRK